MPWATMSPYVKMGIFVGVFVLLFLLIVGFRSGWHFRCYQRIPNTGLGQKWSDERD